MVVALVLLALASACSRSAALPACALAGVTLRHAQQPCAQQSGSHDQQRIGHRQQQKDSDERQGAIEAPSRRYYMLRAPQAMVASQMGLQPEALQLEGARMTCRRSKPDVFLLGLPQLDDGLCGKGLPAAWPACEHNQRRPAGAHDCRLLPLAQAPLLPCSAMPHLFAYCYQQVSA